MASNFITSIVEGQWFYTTDANPNATISAPRGSVALRVDVGNAGAWVNTDGLSSWSQFLTVTSNGDLDLTSVDQILLADNANPALAIGSTGLLNLLEFRTSNGAERIDYNGALSFRIISGGLDVNAGGITVFAGGLAVNAGAVSLPEGSLDTALATKDAADKAVSAGLFIPVIYPAGAGPTSVALPGRVGGWRVVDTYIVANGNGGSLQVFNGASPVSGVMNEGGANVITRTSALTLANASFASSGTITLTGVVGTSGGTCFIRIEPR
jgi:hypothetical protein